MTDNNTKFEIIKAPPSLLTDNNTKFEIIKAPPPSPPAPLYVSTWKDFYQNTKYTVLKVDFLQDRET